MLLALRNGDTSYVQTEEQRDQLLAQGRKHVTLTTASQREIAMKLLEDGYNHFPPLAYLFYDSETVDGQLAIVGDPLAPESLTEERDYIALLPLIGG